MEHRRYQRTPIDLPLEFTHSESKERTPGRATDLAVGGMFVQTSNPATFGAEIVLFVMFPGERRTLELPAVVRWTRPGQGMGLQFGLLGARETHAIMEACHSAKANTPTS
jgi:type IV pilus assembly protein PilZ